jgi:ribosome-binding factor A
MLMSPTSNRLDRINDQVAQELASLVRSELSAPGLGMISVLSARVSKDLAHADVYVSVLGAEAEVALEILRNASGFLRSQLARNLNMRATPKLKFYYDESVERGRNLSSLIDRALDEDSHHSE